MPKILIVDDEPDIVALLDYNLEKQGYRTVTALNGEEALLVVIEEEPDLILLDLDMPKINGLEVCRRLRQSTKTNTIPIIMLTAWSQKEDVVKGLQFGADDYITKPFDVEVLSERVKALLRRVKPRTVETILVYHDLTMNTETHRVTRGSRLLSLGPTEYAILEVFLRDNPGKVFSRETFLIRVWENNHEVDDRTVDVHIGRLRKILNRGKEPDLIRTVRGAGYSLDASAS